MKMGGNAPGGGVDFRARLEELYASFAPDVRAYARRRIDAAVVDDVVADVFVAAWRKIEQVPEEPLPWLLGVARNVIGNHLRSARRRLALTQRLSNEQPKLFTEANEPGDIIRALASLPERDRESLMLIAWEGLNPREAAVVIGCSPARFRVRFHRAKKKLELALQALPLGSQPGDELRPPSPLFDQRGETQ
jgi:RNA polymerase sigma-70 factor (ECF subfamily)